MEVMRAGFDETSDAIGQWARFAQLYSPYIKKFPEWAHNMALNQSPSSYVAIDTSDLSGEQGGTYRYHWSNRPTAEDRCVCLRAHVNKFLYFGQVFDPNKYLVEGEGKGINLYLIKRPPVYLISLIGKISYTVSQSGFEVHVEFRTMLYSKRDKELGCSGWQGEGRHLRR